MDYGEFLNDLEPFRQKLWQSFQQVEEEAKWFGLLHSNWVTIAEVKVGNGANWKPSFHDNTATLTIGTDFREYYLLGGIYHEVFHSAFHNSPLYKYSAENQRWGDAFCNVFRYYMAKQYSHPDFFIDKFNKDSLKRDEDLLKGDLKWEIFHGIPAYRIIKASGNDYKNFKGLWKNLNQAESMDLDRYFNFLISDYIKRYNIEL